MPARRLHRVFLALCAFCICSCYAAAAVKDGQRPRPAARVIAQGPLAQGRPALQQWAKYKSQKIKRQATDGDSGAAGAGTPTGDNAPVMSPLPDFSGAALTQSVQTQIKNDVNAAISQFTGVPADIQNVVKTALNQIMSQSLYSQTPSQQYQTVSTAIDNKLQQIQDSIPNILLALTPADANNLDQTNDLNALRQCIQTIVANGGLHNAGDGACLSNSGFTLDMLRTQFQTFTNQNIFLAPANAISAVVANVTAYLDSNTLVPATEYLIGNATEAMNNVIKTVSALDRDATNSAFDCFLQALQTISDTPLASREALCDTGNGNGVTSTTTLGEIETAYISRVNQYASGLPPLVARDIQQIGITTMTLKVGSYDAALRDEINTAINSQVSQTAGQTNEIVSGLLDCLNNIYENDPNTNAPGTCNPNSNFAVLNANANIYRDYLNSFVSILPKNLIEDLNQTVQASLASPDGPEAKNLTAQINALFAQASLGTTYSDCEQSILGCTINAMVNGPATTNCTSQASPACQAAVGTFPPFAPSKLPDNSDPYADLIAALQGNGTLANASNYKRSLTSGVAQLYKRISRQRSEAQRRSLQVSRSKRLRRV